MQDNLFRCGGVFEVVRSVARSWCMYLFVASLYWKVLFCSFERTAIQFPANSCVPQLLLTRAPLFRVSGKDVSFTLPATWKEYRDEGLDLVAAWSPDFC